MKLEVGAEIWIVQSRSRAPDYKTEIVIRAAWITEVDGGGICFKFVDEEDPSGTAYEVCVDDGERWLAQEGMHWARRTDEARRALLAALALS